MRPVSRSRLPNARLAVAFVALLAAAVAPLPARAQNETYLGRLGGNPYAADAVANPFGRRGSPYSAESIRNPFGRWGSPHSADGVRNPFARGGPRIYAEDGTYLGRLNANRFDPESVSNPFGRYGNPFSPTSIHNPFGRYGSPFSPLSPNNPYTTQAPVLIGE